MNICAIKKGFWVIFWFLFLLPNTSLFGQNDTTSQQVKAPVGFPVIGVLGDTIFHVYSRLGSANPQERATTISGRIKQIAEAGEDFVEDSLLVVPYENTYDIVYRGLIVTNVSHTDALLNQKEIRLLANNSTYGLPKLGVIFYPFHLVLCHQIQVRVGEFSCHADSHNGRSHLLL